jgi:hypothetical protein
MTDREIRDWLPHSLDDVVRLQRRLTSALDCLSALPRPFDADGYPHPVDEAVTHACRDLENAHDSVLTVRDWLIELVQLVERLLDQRQSVVEAYERGYNACYIDLVARLAGPEFMALRRAFRELEDDEEIPFRSPRPQPLSE